jgi:hypothetical protein
MMRSLLKHGERVILSLSDHPPDEDLSCQPVAPLAPICLRFSDEEQMQGGTCAIRLDVQDARNQQAVELRGRRD